MSKGQAKLSDLEIEAALAGLPEWTREERRWIVRKYRFETFPGAIEFVRLVADAAEAMNHHPFIAIDYRRVTLKLTSWNAGGLTALDFQSANRYDELRQAIP